VRRGRADGLHVRTIRGILHGDKSPHAQTLHRLAEGLGVGVEELSSILAMSLPPFRCADESVGGRAIERHKDLFRGWTEADFDELHSRVGAGGALTVEGALAPVREMTASASCTNKLDLLLETATRKSPGNP